MFGKLLKYAVCLLLVLTSASCRSGQTETAAEKEEKTPVQEVKAESPVRLTVSSAEEPHQRIYETSDAEARELFMNLFDSLWNERGSDAAETVRYAYESIPEGWLEYDGRNLNYMKGFFADRGTDLYYVEMHMNGREKLLRIVPDAPYIEQLKQLLEMVQAGEEIDVSESE